ncbi:MAG: helix-turn-helix domain-containing protein [Candidatus Cybelea sp.]
MREVAEVRLRHPDESLAELGRRCKPPNGKPTVSSRLGALTKLADNLRGMQGSAKAAR